MKRNTLMLLLLSLIFMSYGTRQTNGAGNYKISMNLKGYKDSAMFRMVHLGKDAIIDSGYMINGKLAFTGKVTEPFIARIHADNGAYVILWVDKSNIKIDGKSSDLFYATISGSMLNDQFQEIRNRQKPFQIKRDSLMPKIFSLMSSENEEFKKEMNNMIDQVKKIDKERLDISIEAILRQTPSYQTICELYSLKKEISRDSLKLIFNKFPASLKNTKYGQVISTYLQDRQLAIGDKYVDIYGLDINDKKHTLSDFKGKYVLLEFWASWCTPCLQEIPNLKETFKNYKDKGFEIVSFSLDANKAAWKKAVEKDSLSWINITDLKGWYSKMAALYNVTALPASFLINPDGVIVATNLRGEGLAHKLNEELNKNGLSQK